MNFNELKKVLCVKSLETNAKVNEYWSRESRRDASAKAAENLNAKKLKLPHKKKILKLNKIQENFLLQRAQILGKTLSAETLPTTSPLRAVWPIIITFSVIALLLGFFGGNLSHGKENILNILDLPILFLLAWNAFVYLSFVVALIFSFRKSETKLPRATSLSKLVNFASNFAKKNSEKQNETANETQTLLIRRKLTIDTWLIRAALHVAAFAIALGSLLALLRVAWSTSFQITWESSIITRVENLRAFLDFALAPAKLLGAPPPIEQLGEMGAVSAAAPWLRTYVAALCVVVFIPRLLLAAISLYRRSALMKNQHLPKDNGDFANYLHKCLTLNEGKNSAVICIPYVSKLVGARKEKIMNFFGEKFGGAARILDLAAINPGEEEEFGARVQKALSQNSAEASALCLYFNLNQVPEKESQGLLLEEAQKFAKEEMHDAEIIVCIDTETFVAKNRALTEAAEMLNKRKNLWLKTLNLKSLDAKSNEKENGKLANTFLKASKKTSSVIFF